MPSVSRCILGRHLKKKKKCQTAQRAVRITQTGTYQNIESSLV